jgi:hypothetical protein
MGSASVMSAMTWRRAPQSAQRRTSTANTRFINSAHEYLRSCAAAQIAVERRSDGGEGTMASHHDDAGANTPW